MVQRRQLGSVIVVVVLFLFLTGMRWLLPDSRSSVSYYTHATDCPANQVGTFGSFCKDLDDGRLWSCATPAAGGASATLCDVAGDWSLDSTSTAGAVTTFESRVGNVVSAAGDYTAAEITNTPAGGIAAVTAQTALNELDTEKAPKASPTFTGTVVIPTPFTLGAVSVLPTGTELNFVDGVTSAIQAQIDAKAPTASPTFTGTVTLPTPFTLGAVSVLPTGTELNFVDGVTSNIQTQLDAKSPIASPTFTGTVTLPTPFTLGAVSVLPTGTELNFVDGVTSSIQTQLDAKAPLANPVFTSSLQLPNGAAPTVDAFGEIAGDNNLWGASRGAPVFFDGTSVVGLVGILSTDTCTNGDSPRFNTGGTWTCEASAGAGDALVANPLSQFAATTSAQLAGVLSNETGTGFAVFSGSPVLTGTPTIPTPFNLGAVSVTTDGGELNFVDGVTSNIQNQLDLKGDAFTADSLAQFGATTSAELAGVLSNETGTGAACFATSPTLVTPTLGVATATSINKVTITPVATGATWTIADGKSFVVNSGITLSINGGGGPFAYTVPGASGDLVTADNIANLTNKSLNAGTKFGGVALTASGTEINYLTGVTSGIQAQINAIVAGGGPAGGDLSGTYPNPSVVDDSHNHTSATISGLDISADTNLAVTAPVVLTGDTLSITQNAGTNITADLEEEQHGSEHMNGGNDEISTDVPAAFAIPKAGAGGTLADGWFPAAITRDTELAAHEALTSVHGLTSANTASRGVLRDGSGNFAAGTITANLTGNVTGNATTATTAGTATTTQGNLDTHTALTTAHGATTANTASRIVLRDANGGILLKYATSTVAALPACDAAALHTRVVVTDGLSTTDCIGGGGVEEEVVCKCTTLGWLPDLDASVSSLQQAYDLGSTLLLGATGLTISGAGSLTKSLTLYGDNPNGQCMHEYIDGTGRYQQTFCQPTDQFVKLYSGLGAGFKNASDTTLFGVTEAGIVTGSAQFLEKCVTNFNTDSSDDNLPFASFQQAVTIKQVWCHYPGSAPGTPAVFAFEDGSSNAMTLSDPLVCAAPGGIAVPQTVTAGGSLAAFEMLRYDVTNSPSPSNEHYLLCASYVLN